MTDSPLNLLWSALAYTLAMIQGVLVVAAVVVIVAAGSLVLLFVAGLAFANWVIEEVLP
ncbi:hypothetical protein LZT27_14150 [Aeromonas veronii]|uniref:hypothetical protein n=1 Tax=Aeromonas veronii TaxID=654 RepID=UPI002364A0E8|nr:hypothetical protein [Aeromonas veronii]MDD1845733.1 hypothetical protein [Aeromonas veronii]